MLVKVDSWRVRFDDNDDRQVLIADTYMAAYENYNCVYQIGHSLAAKSSAFLVPKSKFPIWFLNPWFNKLFLDSSFLTRINAGIIEIQNNGRKSFLGKG